MRKKEIRAAMYCRIATDAQRRRRAWLYSRADGADAVDAHLQLARQAGALMELAVARKLDIAGGSGDTGSGLVMDRPGLGEVIRAAREGRFDVLLTADCARIGENAVAACRYLQELRKLDVGVMTLKDGDLTQDGALDIFTACAEKQTCVVLQADHAPSRPWPLMLPAGARDMEEAAHSLGLPSLEEGGFIIAEAHGALDALVKRLEQPGLRELNLLAHVVCAMNSEAAQAFLALAEHMEVMSLPWLIGTAAAMDKGQRRYYSGVYDAHSLGKAHCAHSLGSTDHSAMASLPFSSIGERLIQEGQGVLAGGYFIFKDDGPSPCAGNSEELLREYNTEFSTISAHTMG